MTVTMGFAYHPQRDGAVLRNGDSIFLLMLWSLAGRRIELHTIDGTLLFFPDGLTGTPSAAYGRPWRAAKAWRKN